MEMVISLVTGTWPLGYIPGERQKCRSFGSSFRAVFPPNLHMSRRLTIPNIKKMLCENSLQSTI